MTKSEIIDETVEFYKSNPRAFEEGKPKYITSVGRCCAVGRCLEDPKQMLSTAPVIICGKSERVWTGKDFTEFKPEYRGYNTGFWRNIQRLHDCDRYWEGNSLSEKGKLFLKTLKSNYC